MNFIGASVLYHAEEYLAFWILVMIFDKGEMRDIYMHSKDPRITLENEEDGIVKCFSKTFLVPISFSRKQYIEISLT